MTFIGFPISALVYIIIFLIVHFSKKRIKIFENNLLIGIMFLNLIGVILELGCYYVVIKTSTNTFFEMFILKLYIAYIVTFNFALNLYLMLLTNKKYGQNDFNIVKTFKRDLLLSLFPYIIMIFISYALPLNVFSEDGYYYTYGPSVDILFVLSALQLGLWLTRSIISIWKAKNKNKQQYAILIAVLLFGTLGSLTQFVDQRILILTSMHTMILVIMYFFIENPDLKMIEKLEIAKNEAEKANRAKSDFLSSMSHEIRTPLNAIVGLSEDIASYKNVPKEVIEDTEDILNASQTLLEIVGNILDINKIESGKLEIVNNPYNFKEEIIKLCNVTTTRIGDKPIEFKLDIAEDIPYELIGDKTHIKQVVNNLLSNAIKYTEQGNITLTAKCINQKGYCNLIITVQDTGRGIKADMINKLFTKFERLDIEKNSTTEGTGLGLAITKSLVEMMGGKINVQSQFGTGSIFIVQIPQKINLLTNPLEKISSQNELTLKKEVLNSEKKEELPNYRHKRVLIVDDNKLNIKVATKALSGFDFDIEECYDGEQCLNKVTDTNQYDLILMDIMMPKMSGETAMARLKERQNFKTPVIALTADAVAGAKEKYMAQGFADYIAKPFNKSQIKEKLDLIFGNTNNSLNKEFNKDFDNLVENLIDESNINQKNTVEKKSKVTYVFDSQNKEEYIIKDGKREEC